MPLTILPEMVEYVTVPQLREHLNLTSPSHDAELARFLGAAQDHVQSLIGPVLHREYVEDLPVSRGVVYLSEAPVASVASVAVAGIPLTGWTLRQASGLIRGVQVSGMVTVTYSAGRASCPDAVIVATLIVAEHLWRTQLGGSPSALPVDDMSDAPWGSGFAIPRRAAELLAPYASAPGVA